MARSSLTGFRLTWVDRAGKAAGAVGPEGQYRGVSLSPDGRHVAVHRHDGDGGDIWLMDLARGTPSRLTFDATQENATPVWSPDGSRVAYSSIRDGKPGIYVKAVNTSGAEERLLEQTGTRSVTALDWSADGRFILFGQAGWKTDNDVWQLGLSGSCQASPLLQSSFAEAHAQFSPDGRWLAYTSTESGAAEVLVQSTSPGAGKWVVSSGGGNAPRWRGDSGAPGKATIVVVLNWMNGLKP